MRRGFSLAELLIACAIVAIIASIGITVSIRTLKRKAVESTFDKLVSSLTQMRSSAQSGKTDLVCAGKLLNGWAVIVEADHFTTEGICEGGPVFSVKRFDYPSGVTAYTTPNPIPPGNPLASPNPIPPGYFLIFRPLGQGMNIHTPVTVNITGTVTKSITILPTGEIQ